MAQMLLIELKTTAAVEAGKLKLVSALFFPRLAAAHAVKPLLLPINPPHQVLSGMPIYCPRAIP